MTDEGELNQLVATLLPGMCVRRWEHPEQGMDHVVDIGHGDDHAIVVRRPVSAVYAEHAEVEQEILAELADVLGDRVAVPTMKMSSAEEGVHVQSYVPGRALDAALWETLNRQERHSVTRQLELFMHTLHGLHHAQETPWCLSGVPNLADPRALPAKVALSHERAHTYLYPKLSATQRSAAEEIFSVVLAQIKDTTKHTLVHQDLYSTHLRWDGRRVGVIDFSDMNIGDPAIDYQHLLDISPALAQAVATPHELERAHAYKKWDNLFLVIDHLRTGRGNADEAWRLLDQTLN